MRSLPDRIEIDPNKCHGRPVIRGTRVPVAIITGSLAGGMTVEQVAREYCVSPEDVRAALAYETESLDAESHTPQSRDYQAWRDEHFRNKDLNELLDEVESAERMNGEGTN